MFKECSNINASMELGDQPTTGRNRRTGMQGSELSGLSNVHCKGPISGDSNGNYQENLWKS